MSPWVTPTMAEVPHSCEYVPACQDSRVVVNPYVCGSFFRGRARTKQRPLLLVPHQHARYALVPGLTAPAAWIVALLQVQVAPGLGPLAPLARALHDLDRLLANQPLPDAVWAGPLRRARNLGLLARLARVRLTRGGSCGGSRTCLLHELCATHEAIRVHVHGDPASSLVVLRRKDGAVAD